MYNLKNLQPITPQPIMRQIQPEEELLRQPQYIFTTLTTEDRALFERALAFLNGTGDGSWQERGAIADAIQARLAQR